MESHQINTGDQRSNFVIMGIVVFVLVAAGGVVYVLNNTDDNGQPTNPILRDDNSITAPSSSDAITANSLQQSQPVIQETPIITPTLIPTVVQEEVVNAKISNAAAVKGASDVSADATKNGVVGQINSSPDLTRLSGYIKTSDMEETLSGVGPYTIFAPSDNAFNKIPKSTTDEWLNPQSKADLADVIKYHIVSGTYKAADLRDGMVLKTFGGKSIKVTVKDSKIWLNGGTMIDSSDISADNGMLHIIDTVLTP